MPREKRKWYPGAIYHIMCRGNRRSDIFRDDEDFQVFLTILEQVKARSDFILYSYCLMNNHIHLQLKTEDIPIGKIIGRASLFYVKFFNNKYNYIGHLYQGRYKSEIIESDSYNLEISRYIHLNPVKASMVEEPVDYPWSSYRNYMGEIESKLVDVETVLSYFTGNRREAYKEFVESKMIKKREEIGEDR